MSQYIRYNGILYRAVDAKVDPRFEKELRQRFKELKVEITNTASVMNTQFEEYNKLHDILYGGSKDSEKLGSQIIAWAKHQIQVKKAIWSYKMINVCIKVAHAKPANLPNSNLCKSLVKITFEDSRKTRRKLDDCLENEENIERQARTKKINLD